MAFEKAWTTALWSLPRPQREDAAAIRAEWLGVLAWSRPFYAASYAGRPFPALPDALAESSSDGAVASAA